MVKKMMEVLGEQYQLEHKLTHKQNGRWFDGFCECPWGTRGWSSEDEVQEKFDLHVKEMNETFTPRPVLGIKNLEMVLKQATLGNNENEFHTFYLEDMAEDESVRAFISGGHIYFTGRIKLPEGCRVEHDISNDPRAIMPPQI
jgi:hypothetical protein